MRNIKSTHKSKGCLSALVCRKNSGGFTLIEVLVSVVIFSIGLIGIARLQIVSKQSNYDAIQRVVATSIAQDIEARMRANPTQLAAYSGAGAGLTIGGGTQAVPTTCLGSANPCSEEELFEFDLWEIERALDGVTELDKNGNDAGGLVSPTACLDGPALGGSGFYEIAIAWRGKTELSNPTRHTCGENTGKYGANNEYRRLLFFRVYIA